MTQCHCGRAARGFLWQDPVTRGPIVGACSMRCLDAIHAVRGDMKLFKTETDAIRKAVEPHLADLRAFDYANAPASDIYEFAAWLYAECCDAVAREYEQGTINDDEIPY